MTLYGYISILYTMYISILCLFACLSVFVTVHYGSPISDLPSPCWGWGLVIFICLPVCVCVSVCLCYRAIQTSVWLKLWVNWVMSVCLIVLHDHMDPVLNDLLSPCCGWGRLCCATLVGCLVNTVVQHWQVWFPHFEARRVGEGIWIFLGPPAPVLCMTWSFPLMSSIIIKY